MTDNSTDVETSSQSTQTGLSRYLLVFAPLVVVVTCTAGILIVSGVQALDILRFVAYEMGFVFLPGWLVYVTLNTKRNGLLRQIAVGWALGYVLEILAFILISILGIRSWFVGYPVLVIALTAPIVWRRYRSQTIAFGIGSQDTRSLWGLALICIVALVYLGIGYFAENPLPGTVETVDYYHDYVFHLGIAAEAKHHWPITDPNVVGEPLTYYTFVYIHLAAVSRVTGLALPLVLFRLYIVPLFVLLAIQLYVLGTTFGGNRWIGLLTLTLVLLVGEVDPFPKIRNPFLGHFFFQLYQSPTFLLGFVFFIPIVIEMHDRINPSVAAFPRRGSWLLVILLLIGCGGAKAMVLPIALGGLGLYLVWNWWNERRLNLAALTGLGLVLVVFTGFSLFIYGTSSYPSVGIKPFTIVSGSEITRWCLSFLPSSNLFKALCYVLVGILSFIGLMGVRVVGLLWLGWSQRVKFSKAQAWLTFLFLTSLIPYYMLSTKVAHYFFGYGYVAACALAAQGLYVLWQHKQRLGFFSGRFFSLSLVALALLGTVDTPIDHASQIYHWLKGEPTYSQYNRNLTLGLLQGLNWVRGHTNTDAVLAVNNSYSDEARTNPRYFYYSAFAERRTFLGGWMFTGKAHRVGYSKPVRGGPGELPHPFPDRFDLNQRVFVKADPAAIDIMVHQYGVTHLLVDKVHGDPVPPLDDVARLVYANPDVEIYATGPGQ